MKETDVEFLARLIKESHDDLAARLDGHDVQFEAIDARFTGVDGKFEGVDKKFGILISAIEDLQKDATQVKGDIQDLKLSSRTHTESIRELTASIDNLKGLPLEIDHVLTRVGVIEKHLGIKPVVVSEYA